MAVIAAGAAFAASARAEAPLDLSWTAPPSCPSREAIIAEVERLLASRAPRSSRVTARATITKARADYHLRMVVQGANGERARALDAPTCEELCDAAALILAIAIDPSAADPPAKPSPAPAPSIAPPKPTEPVERRAPPPSVPVRRTPPPPARVAPPVVIAEPMSLRLVAMVGADQGTFVGATPSLRVGAAFVAPPLRIELLGMFTWGGRIAAPMLPSAGGEMLRAGGALAGCFERSLDPGDKGAPRASICGGFEGGVIFGTSYGVTSPGSATAPWLAPTVYGVVRWPVRRALAVRFDLGIAVPIVEASFVVRGLGTVHRVSAVTGSGDIGIELDIF